MATKTGFASGASSYQDPAADWKRGNVLLIVALVLTALAYAASLRFAFVYDDLPQIVNNSTLTTWKTLPGLFTSHSWKFLFPDWTGNYYRPLFMTWLLLNRKLFDVYAPAWHATSVLLHLIATWLAFLVARQLFRDSTKAGFTALLFGLHPMHVETVAWVSGATDTLMAVFALASIWAWIRGQREPQNERKWKVLAVIFYVASCLSKETGVLLPIVVLAHDLLRGRYERDWKGFRRALWNSLPLWICAAAYIVVRAVVLHGLAHSVNEPASHIVLTIPTIFWGYMRRLVWPATMSVFYDTPVVTSPIQVRFWLPMLGLVLAIVLAWRIGKRSHLTALALIWMAVFLRPAIIGLPAFPRGEWIHDRYLYLPSFGFCLLVVYAISQLASEREIFGLAAVPSAITLLLVAIMAFDTTYQEQFWANDLLLFAHATRVAPHSAWAKTHLANELYHRGDLRQVEPLYQEALQIDPQAWKIRVSYGIVLFYLNQFQRADQEFAKAIAQAPFDSNPYFYQGMSRFNLANYKGAEQSFQEALQRSHDHIRYHFWLGFTYEKEGRLSEARAEYEKELAQHPETDTAVRERLQGLDRSPGI